MYVNDKRTPGLKARSKALAEQKKQRAAAEQIAKIHAVARKA